MKLNSKTMKMLIVLLIVATGAGVFLYIHRGEVSTDNATIDGRTVTLSPKVSGYVKKVNVSDNQLVKAGDVLIEIDSTDYIIRRERAKATLAAAQAAADTAASNLDTTTVAAPSQIDTAEAQVASAKAMWDKAYSNRQRMEALYTKGACSRQQLDEAVASEQSARATLDANRAGLRSASTAPTVINAAKSNTSQLQAQVKQAEADVEQTENDLANTKIIAPMDGRITKRSVEVGSYVQSGQQLGALVGVELWVTANFKETQLEKIRPGQLVDIGIDAYPTVKLRGKVDSFQAGTGSRFSLFPSENATGNFVKTVQRVPVKIVLENIPDGLPLGPGMSVIPTVFTDGRSE